MKVFGLKAKQHKQAKHAVLSAAHKQAAKQKPVLGVLGDS